MGNETMITYLTQRAVQLSPSLCLWHLLLPIHPFCLGQLGPFSLSNITVDFLVKGMESLEESSVAIVKSNPPEIASQSGNSHAGLQLSSFVSGFRIPPPDPFRFSTWRGNGIVLCCMLGLGIAHLTILHAYVVHFVHCEMVVFGFITVWRKFANLELQSSTFAK